MQSSRLNKVRKPRWTVAGWRTARPRVGRIFGAMTLAASAGMMGAGVAGAVTNSPGLSIQDPTIERGTSTAFTSTFTMDEGTAQATLNFGGADLTGSFSPVCTATGGRTCTVSPAEVVTVTDGGPSTENVSVTISGTITAGPDFPLGSTEGVALIGTASAAVAVTITLDQGSSPQTSAPQNLTIQANPATDAEVQITTTGPASGATAGRGSTIDYTATLRRVGFIGQTTTATATLVADSAGGTTVSVGTQTVSWAANDTADKPVTLTVAVPSGAASGATATYRIVVTYDPRSTDPVAVTDTETGNARSFTIAPDIELVSGSGTGATDPKTLMSLDGGTTFQPAIIINPHSLYSTIPGTRWVSDPTAGSSRQHTTTIFQTTFELPAGFQTPSITVEVHADNAATVLLNGTEIGAQPEAEIVPNFRDPAESYTATGPFVAGTNVLRFVVRNFSGPMGLDYRAGVSYSLPVNAPPVLALPADITVDATGPDGTSVSYSATATDDIDPSPVVTCTPPSGSTFAIGTTTVTCTVTDSGGLSASGSFAVTVRGAGPQLDDLLLAVDGVGPGKSLPAKVRSIRSSLAAGDLDAACGQLGAFVNELQAQAAKSVPEPKAQELIAAATRIRAVLGCSPG